MGREEKRPFPAFADWSCTGIIPFKEALYTIKIRMVTIDMTVKKKSN